VFTAGLAYSNGPPTFNPGAKGTKYAIDTVAWNLYVNSYGTTWSIVGDWLHKESGCATPVYTPTKFQSNFVINECSPPELYYYNGLSWEQIGGGGSGTTDLTFTGSVSPITLNSSTGTDVQFKDSLGISIRQVGQVMTFLNTAGLFDGNKGDITVSGSGATWDINSGVVGPTELASTAVTPASYTNTNLTVDSNGRITAASNGAAGLGGTGLTNRLGYYTSPTTLGYDVGMVLDTVNNRMGVNTQAPTTTLDVNGTITIERPGTLAFSDTITNGYFITVDGDRFMHTRGENDLNKQSLYIGRIAGPAVTNAASEDNTVVGNRAGTSLTSGSLNTIMGAKAGRNLTTGAGNTIFGAGAGEQLTNNTNCLIGRSAGAALTNGSNNMFFGDLAGSGGITTGSNNTIIGASAGNSGGTAGLSGCVFLGQRAGQTLTRSNSLWIDNQQTDPPLLGGQMDNNYLGVNTIIANIDAALEVTGTGSTSSTTALDVSNSLDSIILFVGDERKVGINTATPDVSFDMGESTDGFKMQAGTTAQRPSVNNTQRVNTDSLKVEVRLNGTYEIYATGFRSNKALDFPSTAISSYSDLTLTVTGASVGDVCSLGVPASGQIANVSYNCWVSASNVVTVRLINNDAVNPADPTSGTFKVFVTK